MEIPLSGVPDAPKPGVRRFLRVVSILAAIAAVGVVLYLYWRQNSEWLAGQEEKKKYQAAEAFMTEYDEAMKADTYGGKTPEETLQLFVSALEKGDMDLASKYFMLETNERDPDYLTRRKWEEGLQSAYQEERIEGLVFELKSMQKSQRTLGTSNAEEYVLYGGDGVVERSLTLIFNKEASIWKIESL